MSKILSVGELLWDVFPDKEIIGGATFNVAVHARALGLDTCFLSRVGCDARGASAMREVESRGISTEFMQTDEHKPNGTAVVTLDKHGVAVYDIPQDVSHNFIAAGDEIIADLNAAGFDLICYGTIAQKGGVSRASIRRVLRETSIKHRFLDVNLRMNFHEQEVLDFSFDKATIVKINDEETAIVSKILFGRELAGNAFAEAAFERYSLECVLITMGGDGCAVYGGGRDAVFPAPEVKVVDTVGAGDAFSAGFIYKYLNSGDIFGAARFGNAMGAYVASKQGATPPLDLSEIKKLYPQG